MKIFAMGWRRAALLSLVSLGLVWLIAPSVAARFVPAASAEMKQAGHELFVHQWVAHDPQAHGDGLGPMHSDDSTCTFSSGSGLVTCTTTTRDGLTVTRVSKYTTTAGQVQQARDSTTNTVVSTVTVSGTATRRDSSKSVVSESSNQTVTGLAQGSTQRTVNGTSAGTENTTGTSSQGAFTATRVAGDTVKGVVIPVPASTTPTYPTAGTVIRAMNATVTITGQSPTTSSRREVITYDGSATAKVVITHDGTTQNCTLPLPRGHLTCQ